LKEIFSEILIIHVFWGQRNRKAINKVWLFSGLLENDQKAEPLKWNTTENNHENHKAARHYFFTIYNFKKL